MLPKIPVEGHVLFTAGSQFPKGKPDNVLRIDEIKQLIIENPQPIAEELTNAWQALREKAQPANQIHLSIYLRRGDLSRLIYGVVLLTVALGWLTWHVVSVVLS